MANKMMWGTLLHLGHNMWNDCPRDCKGVSPRKCYGHPKLNFVDDVWREVTERMQAGGLNTLVLDLGEGLVYPSHPELAVEGSWEPERMKAEIERLKKMGIEVIPKLNFSACHDAWLGEYSRMLSTDEYYQACSEIIGDVFAIFGKPRFLHLGYDEETAHMQKDYLFTCVRQGELWWKDFLFFVRETEKRGGRAWIWSDYMWNNEKSYLARMPRTVLQSNWYYGRRWEGEKPEIGYEAPRLPAFDKLDKAGFDQVPTGTNWVPPYFKNGDTNDRNFAGIVRYCRAHVSRERLKGFLNASWESSTCGGRPRRRILDCIDQVAAEIRKS